MIMVERSIKSESHHVLAFDLTTLDYELNPLHFSPLQKGLSHRGDLSR